MIWKWVQARCIIALMHEVDEVEILVFADRSGG